MGEAAAGPGLRDLSASELGRALGKHRNTIRAWVAAGCPVQGRADRDRGEAWRFDLVEVVAWLERRAAERAAGPLRDRIRVLEAAIAIDASGVGTSEDEAKLELRQRRGELVRGDDVDSLSPFSLAAILQNPIYRGELVWGRSRWSKVHATGRRRRAEVPDAEWVRREAHELAIVSPELWQAAQETRTKRQRGAKRDQGGRIIHVPARAKGRLLLSGLLVCGACGGAFGAQHRGRWGCNAAHQRGICGERWLVAQGSLEAAVERSPGRARRS